VVSNTGAAVNVVPESSNASADVPLELIACTYIIYAVPDERLDNVAVNAPDSVVIDVDEADVYAVI
jgi:hypothetical protein